MYRSNQSNLSLTKKNYSNISKLSEKILKTKSEDSDSTLEFGVVMLCGKLHKKNLKELDQYLRELWMLIIAIKHCG